MTHPAYRKKGLSASLMNKVLEEYENAYDIMYLFANDTVLDFYPKFGFHPVAEHQFNLDYRASQSAPSGIKKLNVDQPDDLHFIYRFTSERLPVSQRFGAIGTQDLFMFYCLNVFSDHIYYLEHENVIVIYIKEDPHMDLFDIVSIKNVRLQDILTKIAGPKTEKITLHFTPDDPGIETESTIIHSGLFVRTNGANLYPMNVKHPMTAIA